ncbi:hypothetical protein LCGC14_0664120 [marine sediment metagenome]|uniref:Uncharacterized protein n=1 Tax=marine sediment metagenome TaxID=412755 RepID=A0A0F9RCW4_9ZZZZ
MAIVNLGMDRRSLLKSLLAAPLAFLFGSIVPDEPESVLTLERLLVVKRELEECERRRPVVTWCVSIWNPVPIWPTSTVYTYTFTDHPPSRARNAELYPRSPDIGTGSS